MLEENDLLRDKMKAMKKQFAYNEDELIHRARQYKEQLMHSRNVIDDLKQVRPCDFVYIFHL